MDAKKKPPRPRYYATEDVAKVVVGIRRQEFFIHKKLASFYSAVLKREFQKVNTEGRSNFIVLEETDAEIFALFAEWLYMQKLDLDEDGSNGITNKSLVRLWVLGEKLVVSSLQNMTINLLHEIYKRTAVISTMNLSYVYENTKAGSPLRRFFVDLCAYGLVPDVLRENPHHFPPEMLLDLAIATSSLLRKSRYEIRDIEITKYHV